MSLDVTSNLPLGGVQVEVPLDVVPGVRIKMMEVFGRHVLHESPGDGRGILPEGHRIQIAEDDQLSLFLKVDGIRTEPPAGAD
jgi:hypothetical protein